MSQDGGFGDPQRDEPESVLTRVALFQPECLCDNKGGKEHPRKDKPAVLNFAGFEKLMSDPIEPATGENTQPAGEGEDFKPRKEAIGNRACQLLPTSSVALGKCASNEGPNVQAVHDSIQVNVGAIFKAWVAAGRNESLGEK